MAVTPLIKLPIHLVLDFDGTLTCKDTMHLVAECGYAHQIASGRVPQPPSWSEIVDAYMTDFKEHANSYVPQAVERNSPEREFAWLDSLEQTEEASFQRVLAAGVFDGTTKVEMEKAGRSALHTGQLKLRSGWHHLAVRVRQHNAISSTLRFPIRILSVNWSATFIQGALQQASEDFQMEDPLVHARHIYANEIPSITSSGAGYQPSSRITALRTSGAKASILQKFRPTVDDKENSLLIYVGDSVTDLACLLAADFGFCVHDNPMTSGQKELAEVCRRIGIGISPIAEALSPSNKGKKTLWSIQDFSEIVHWLDRAEHG